MFSNSTLSDPEKSAIRRVWQIRLTTTTVRIMLTGFTIILTSCMQPAMEFDNPYDPGNPDSPFFSNIVPNDGSEDSLTANTMGRVTFRWAGVDHATAYRIQIGIDEKFGSPEVDDDNIPAGATSYSTTVLDDGTWYWRVCYEAEVVFQGESRSGWGPWHGPWEAVIDHMPVANTTVTYDADGITQRLLGWNTMSDGSGESYVPGAQHTIPDNDVTLYAQWTTGTDLVGKIGPAGGYVFYDDEADGVSDVSAGRFLEAAPELTEWSDTPWGGTGTEVGPTAQGTFLGAGAGNTAEIVATYGESEPYEGRNDYAANLCNGLSVGGFDDWFLPSQDELMLVYDNLYANGGIGDFTPGYYWSSSEADSADAHVVDFGDGHREPDPKDNGYRVRAVRAFGNDANEDARAVPAGVPEPEAPGVPGANQGAVTGSAYSYMVFDYHSTFFDVGYNTDVSFYESEAQATNAETNGSVDGNAMLISFIDGSDSPEVDPGTYTVTSVPAADSVPAIAVFSGTDSANDTMEYAAVNVIAGQVDTGDTTVDEFQEITSGTVTVNESAGIYTIHWQLTTSSGLPIAGFYQGAIDRTNIAGGSGDVQPDWSLSEPTFYASAPGNPHGATFDEDGNFWVVNQIDSTIVQIASDGSVVASVAYPGSSPTGLTGGGGDAFWIADNVDLTLTRMQVSGQVTDVFAPPVGNATGLTSAVVDRGTLFLASFENAGTIFEIDAIDGSIVQQFAAPSDGPEGLTYDAGYLWHADIYTNTIYVIDPDSHQWREVLDVWATAPGPIGLARSGNTLAIVSQVNTELYFSQIGGTD